MRIVIALGGNALLQRGQPMTAENQRANIRLAAERIASIAPGNEIVIAHGNGPQVGLLALQDLAYEEVDPYPLDVLGAASGLGAAGQWSRIGAGVAFALTAAAVFGAALVLTQHEVAAVDGRVRTITTMGMAALVGLGMVVSQGGFHLPQTALGWGGLAALIVLPRLPTACGSLPPEGAFAPWGGPAALMSALTPTPATRRPRPSSRPRRAARRSRCTRARGR